MHEPEEGALAGPMSGTVDPDFVTILQTYNDVTARLKRSHDTLMAEVARLREEVHEKNKQLAHRERLAALGEMAAGVAHEIRNPLGGIGLYSSLLERDLADRPVQCDIARRISAGVQNLEAIVRDILAFAGGAPPMMEPADARTIVDSALSQVSARIAAMETELFVDPRLAGLSVLCDSGQMERAIANLVLNAIDAADRRGPFNPGVAQRRGRVWIRFLGFSQGEWPADRQVRICVEDNGPGIPQEVIRRIFNPFFTTKHHGTGLGLAIVHRIIEAHGGHISAGERVGGGASFVLSLPVDPAIPMTGTPESPGKSGRSPAALEPGQAGKPGPLDVAVEQSERTGRVLRQRVARRMGRPAAPV